MASAIIRMSRALGTTGSAMARTLASAAASGSGSGSSVKEPTYTYQYLPPGSSMREPIYISMSDPVYFYDVPPAAPSSVVAPPGDEKPSAYDNATGGKLPFASISGAPKPADNKPVSYKMVDDMAQVPYITSPNHSMREPKYVSIADPSYPGADKQQKK